MTAPWEFSQDGKLKYYDFELDELKIDRAYKFYARRRVFPTDVETRYNELIETPLSSFIHGQRQGAPPEISRWEVQRAAYLLFFAQAPRVLQARKEESDFSDLMRFAHRNPRFLCGEIHANVESCGFQM